MRNIEQAQWHSQQICACAVFGVCADDDFPRNETAQGPIFRHVRFIERSVTKLETNRLTIVFHPVRKADSENF